ncbi:MAG: aminotransferase class III-fold pyridoxal phosphate-dependent enzyme [Proteobacteria bacterium]|nr:aminotransferase class III-fold pyridoxal phosphate-dependent enzyme [Pseudomonadota bacterium]
MPRLTPSCRTGRPGNRSTADWQAADNGHYLHPFSDYKELHAEGARIQVRAEGIYMWDTQGNRIIDGLAGLGCVNIGYGRQELARVAAEQMSQLSFCQSFFRTSNQPAIELAEQLTQLAPAGLTHVFYASSGSEANETCFKLARRYWQLAGRPQKKIVIARANAYHGSTIATSSLSGLPDLYDSGGDMPIAGIARIGAPYWYLEGADLSPEEFGMRAAGWLEARILDLGADNVAAFFAEPIQGAGGAIIPPATYWPEIQRICTKYEVLLSVDEVVCGFGRTGHWFGSHRFGIQQPDLMAVAKGITSAYIPLSAALVSNRVAAVLIDRGGEFYHGFTHSGHPVACAVALENIRILREERIVEHVAAIEPHFAARVAALADHPLVGDVRSCGLFAGIQLVADKRARQMFDSSIRAGDRCSREALARGLALRSIGDTMALMPPLVITEEEIDTVFDITREALDATARQLERGTHGPR